MSVLSIIIIIVLLVFLSASLFYNVKLGILVLRMQDDIEESLDMLDERYESISKILEIPLFYDSNEIRTVLDDVQSARNTILHIARSLASIDESAVENEGDTSD